MKRFGVRSEWGRSGARLLARDRLACRGRVARERLKEAETY